MRLYSFRLSPNPLKVRMALAELGAPYENVEVDLFKGEQRLEEFKRVNPAGQLPVLTDGDFTLRESNAILVYLGREYGRSRWPATPRQECEALQWLFFESSQLSLACGQLWWSDTVAPRVGREPYSEGTLAGSVEKLERSLDAVEHQLKAGAYLLGSEFTLVDCSFGVTLSMLEGTRVWKNDRWPLIRNYLASLKTRESWSAADGDAIQRLG